MSSIVNEEGVGSSLDVAQVVNGMENVFGNQGRSPDVYILNSFDGVIPKSEFLEVDLGIFPVTGNISGEDLGWELFRKGVYEGDFSVVERVSNYLDYSSLKQWFQEHNLEKFLLEGSLENEVLKQELFYQKFYGEDFRVNREGIFVSKSRLPAIKEGLNVGAIDRILLKATPTVLTEEQSWHNIHQFFACEILKKSEVVIESSEGHIRWNGKTLDECLAGYVNVFPADFNKISLQSDWEKECLRVANRKGLAPRILPGMTDMAFVSSQCNSMGQKYVNQHGKVVEVADGSFVTAVVNDLQLLTPAEEILLTVQLFMEDGKYPTGIPCRMNSALLIHEGVSVKASVASVIMRRDAFFIHSYNADSQDESFHFGISL